MIRNRIDALVKDGIVRKQTIEKEVFVMSVNLTHFPYKDMQIIPENIEAYLGWRFPMRELSTLPTIKKFVDAMTALGYNSIGYVDDIVIKQIDRFLDYERQYFPDNEHKSIGAVRACIGLSDPKLGKNGASPFYILNFEKFITIENEINNMVARSN